MKSTNTNTCIKKALKAHLADMPAGASITQLCALTGATRKQVTGSLLRSHQAGEIYALMRYRSSAYFATEEMMEAARADVAAAWGAEVEMYRARRAARQKQFRSEDYMARLSVKCKARRAAARAARGVLPMGAKAEKVAQVRVLKVEMPKPKKPAALVFVKTPISKAKPTATRKGWGRDDPVHITADTIITIYKAPTQVHYRTNTHFQY